MKCIAFATLFIISVSLTTPTKAEEQTCRTNIAVNWNVPTEGYVWVLKNKRCVITAGTVSGAVSDAEIVTPPNIGKAWISKNRFGGVVYEPHKNYLGPAEMTYRRNGTDRWGRPATRTVILKIQVVDKLTDMD
jgi:hypothetical protein